MTEDAPIRDEDWQRVPKDVREMLVAVLAQKDREIADLVAALARRVPRTGWWEVPRTLVSTYQYDGTGVALRARSAETTTYEVAAERPRSGCELNCQSDDCEKDADEPFISGS